MREGIALVTPTSDRPAAFQLCERWMRRQTYAGPLQWIVADDGIEPAPCTMGQLHIRLPPNPDPVRSFCGNLASALERVEFDRVIFIEDDDWYHPDYLLRQIEWLDRGFPVAGEARSKYYNILRRSWHIHRVNQPIEHASLCQTAMCASLIKWLVPTLRQKPTTLVDKRIWRRCGSPLAALMPESQYCIGIKGLPGKASLELGPAGLSERCRKPDADGAVLEKWIGAEDAAVYFALVTFPNQEAVKTTV